MILHVESDASYLVLRNVRSNITGHYFLSSTPPLPPAPPKAAPNGPILTEYKSLEHVVASAAEAETGGLFYNGQTIIPIRQSLEALGHVQPSTPLKTDNSTARDFVDRSLRQTRSKSWDMRFHWLRDRHNRMHLHIYWDKGPNNTADYCTKHHTASHHRLMRSRFI